MRIGKQRWMQMHSITNCFKIVYNLRSSKLERKFDYITNE